MFNKSTTEVVKNLITALTHVSCSIKNIRNGILMIYQNKISYMKLFSKNKISLSVVLFICYNFLIKCQEKK